jgi:hypothetical protein
MTITFGEQKRREYKDEAAAAFTPRLQTRDA